jgi:hypothetical protein
MYPGFRIQAARALALADQQQYERDNPEAAGKAKGGAKVNVGVQVNNQVDVYEMARKAAKPDPLEEAKKQVEQQPQQPSE